MGDENDQKPDPYCLFLAASEHQGHFTNEDAKACGYSRFLLARHAASGRFVRIRRGLYRLRDYPSSPREDVVAAWLAVGPDTAVVSHESALDVLDLSDAIPHAVHLTVPRSKRHLPNLPGVAIHTTTRPIRGEDVVVRDGLRITSVERTILDAAEFGTAPEQVEHAVRQAIERGLLDGGRLRRDAALRSRRVQRLVRGALGEASG